MDAPSLNVPPTLFAKQMDFISDNFNVIDPDQLMEGDYERPAALITFDDGMLGYFSNAVPIMTDRQIPSINFLNMDTIEGNPSWAGLVTYLADVDVDFQRKIGHDEDGPPVEITLVSPGIVREYLSSMGDESLVGRVREFTGAIATRRDLEAVQDSSLVFLGNHLANHYSTLTLGKEELSEQYSRNQSLLNHYANARPMFAYPHGRFRPIQNDLLGSLGAEAIFYSSEGINRRVSGRFYNRLSVDSHMTCVEDLVGQIRWVEFRRSMNWDYRGDLGGCCVNGP